MTPTEDTNEDTCPPAVAFTDQDLAHLDLLRHVEITTLGGPDAIDGNTKTCFATPEAAAAWAVEVLNAAGLPTPTEELRTDAGACWHARLYWSADTLVLESWE